MIAEFLAVLAAVSFSFNTIMVQRAMKEVSSSTVLLINLLINNLVFLPLLFFFFFRHEFTLSGIGFAAAAAAGLAGNMLGRSLSYQAVKRIGSPRTIMLTLTQTLFAFIFGLLILGEALTVKSFTGIVLVVSGVYWVAREEVSEKEILNKTTVQIERQSLVNRYFSPGILFAIAAGLSFSTADLLRRVSLKVMPSAIVASAIGGVVAFGIQAFVSSMKGDWRQLTEISKKAWLNLILAGGASALAVILLNTALTFSQVVVVNSLYNTKVLFVILMSPFLLGTEGKLSKAIFASSLMIVGGTALIIFGKG